MALVPNIDKRVLAIQSRIPKTGSTRPPSWPTLPAFHNSGVGWPLRRYPEARQGRINSITLWPRTRSKRAQNCLDALSATSLRTLGLLSIGSGRERRLSPMRDHGGVVLVLDVLAVVLTVARTWPQFIRIVVRRDKTGVSVLTWMLVMISHLGWLMYGILDHVVLLIVVNALCALGCAAILLRLRPVPYVLAPVVGMPLVSVALYGITNGALLAAIIALSLVMFIPQVLRVFRAPHHGVSPLTWTLSALSSVTWISWSIMVERPVLAAAHYVMLPTALVILGKTLRRRPGVAPVAIAP